MGLVKGSSSFVRFGVEGQLPPNGLDFIADRVASFSFKDIDDNYDEYSIGWVSVLNMFDARFQYCSFAVGDYVTLSMRIDERKVSAAVVKKFVQKEEERVRHEKQVPKLSKGQKLEIKERVTTELTRKALPVPAVYDVCWNLSESTVLFFSTNKKIHSVLEDFFNETFGLLLRQQIPYVVGEDLLEEESLDALASMTPEIFV